MDSVNVRLVRLNMDAQNKFNPCSENISVRFSFPNYSTLVFWQFQVSDSCRFLSVQQTLSGFVFSFPTNALTRGLIEIFNFSVDVTCCIAADKEKMSRGAHSFS